MNKACVDRVEKHPTEKNISSKGFLDAILFWIKLFVGFIKWRSQLLAVGFVFSVVALFPNHSFAETLEISVDSAGWYNNNSFRRGGGGRNYYSGEASSYEYRGFFAFEIPSFSGELESVTLQIYSYTVYSPPVNFAVYDVASDANTVTTSSSAQPAIFNDLGSGNVYANLPIAGSNILHTITLNAQAIADINAAKGGKFIIGFASTEIATSVSKRAFLSSALHTDNKLILSIAEDTVTPAVQLTSGMMETRSQLIMRNQPNAGRRLDRLNNRVQTNSLAGFGLTVNSSALPFSAELNDDSARISWSSRNKVNRKGKTHVSADLGTLARSLGAREEVSQAASMLSAFSRSQKQLDVDRDGTKKAFVSSNNNEAANERLNADVATEQYGLQTSDSPYDFWLEGQYSRFSLGNNDGNFAILHGGVDYLVNERLLLGFSGQFEWTEMENAGSGSITGQGYMFGPYLTAKLSESAYFDARVAWGRSTNKTSPLGTFTDEFDTERWLATATLIGQMNWNQILVQPEVRLSWFHEQSEAYVDNQAAQIPSITVERGTLEFGPTFFLPAQEIDFGSIQFQFGFEGIWTFASENSGSTATTNVGSSDEGLTARTEAGITLITGENRSASTFVSYDGIGDNNYEAWSIMLLLKAGF